MLWNPYGIHLESIWNLFGIHMESIWNPYGIHLESIWNPYGIHLESIWNPFGIHMESIWNPVEWWWNQHHHSMWNPDGRSRLNDEIQMEFGHSMWNIGRMESPKRVGSQPKYIPSGIRWISLGFHMDSMWNTWGE